MTTLWDCVGQLGAGSRTSLSEFAIALLNSTVTTGPTPAGAGHLAGETQLSLANSFLGIAQLDLGKGLAGTWAFDLRASGGGFVLDLHVGHAKLPLPSLIKPAADDGSGHLVPGGAGPVHVVVDTCLVRMDASIADRHEHLSLVPAVEEGLFEALLEPPDVLLGDGGFGLHLPKVAFDATASETALAALPIDWTGVVFPGAKLYFPDKGPNLLPDPVDLDLAISDRGAVYAKGHMHWPKSGQRPDIVVDVLVDDPLGGGVMACVPTSASVVLRFEDPVTVPVAGPVPTGGLVVTVSFSRTATKSDGQPPAVTMRVAAASASRDGLVELDAGSTGASTAVAASAFADALMNGNFGPDGLVDLALLLGLGAAMSGKVDGGRVVVTRAEAVAGFGPGSPDPVLVLDYDSSIHFQPIDLGVISLRMDETPLALGYRDVKVHRGQGLPVALDYSDARVEIKSVGGWHIDPDVLPLKIPAVRFGQGSLWAEFDIDVAMELGPIQVDRATVRLHFDPSDPGSGFAKPELRGLGIHMEVPGAIKVAGQARLADGGIAASLTGVAGPAGHGFAVSAQFRHTDALTGLAVSVAFPGPIPLASSGFGIFGAEGGFAVGAEPKMAPGDPIEAALAWQPSLDSLDKWRTQAGDFTFWLGLMIGTLPDAGFSLNAFARLAVAVPDLLFRLSLDGQILATPDSDPGGGGPGAGFLGVLQYGPAGLDVGLRGKVDLLPLLEIEVPVSAHFPLTGSDWFVRIGTDNGLGRPPGPVHASLLPDLFGVDAWAFLMFEGGGVSNLAPELMPGNNFPATVGFTIAGGAGFDLRYGSPPFWLEVSGGFVAELGTDPFLIAASAYIGGSLHLGPFSLGADAKIEFIAGRLRDESKVLWAKGEVCGSIDLWLFEIEGCVTIEFGSRPEPQIAPPNPLLMLSMMRPDGTETPTDPNGGHAHTSAPDQVPTVWPDTIPTLCFSTLPTTAAAGGNVKIGPNSSGGETGSDNLKFEYQITALDLKDQDGIPFVPKTDDGQPTDLLATVQEGKGTDGSREIAINTWRLDQWARALEDGGTTTGDPASITVQQCGHRVQPRPGWTLGVDAAGGPALWSLPPDHWASDPLESMVSATGEVIWNGTDLTDEVGWAIDAIPGVHLVAAAVERFDMALAPSPSLPIPRDFDGALWLPSLVFTGLTVGNLQEHRSTLRLRPVPELASPSMMAPTICLLMDHSPVGGSVAPSPWSVTTDGTWWKVVSTTGHPYDESLVVVVLEWTGSSPVAVIDLTWHQGRVGLLGLGGVTVAASNSADATNKALDDRHAVVEAAATPPATLVGPGRLFAPNTSYSVDVQMGWVKKLPAGDPTLNAFDSPGGTIRTFRTAPEGSLPDGAGDWEIGNDESIFCPEYLHRYLHPVVPCTPPDLTRFVFPKDAVQVRFWVEHTEQLAALYGYSLHLRIRRVDAHPVGEGPTPQVTDLSTIVADLGGALLFAVDERVAELSLDENVQRAAQGLEPCLIPTPGTTKTIPAVLTCGGQFELRIVAVRNDEPEHVIKTTTFSTSMYEDPRDLLWELGLQRTGDPVDLTRTTLRGWQDQVRSPTPRGELVVAPLSGLSPEQRGDVAFDAAMEGLGLDPWPICAKPRILTLWVAPSDAGPWLLHGVLLESPEPIIRDPRLKLSNPTVGGVPLGHRIIDATGCRVLILADPFAPAGSLSVDVVETVGGEAGTTPTVTTWTASTTIPPEPAVAGEIEVS